MCSVRRAHVLVWKGKAEVLESLPKGLRSATDTFVWPHVIRLVQYVRVPRAIQRKISRRALFARDGWRCVYCGTSSGRLTLDHVIPRSKGGESIWENVVTACAPCNLRKGDRLLADSGCTCSGRRGRRRRCSSSTWQHRRSRKSGSSTCRGRRRPPSVAATCGVCGETHDGDTRHARMSLPRPDPPHRRVGAGRARLGRRGCSRPPRRRPGTVLRPRAARAPDRGGGGLLPLRQLDRGQPRGLRGPRRALARRGRLAKPPVLRHARQRAASVRVHGGPAGAAPAARGARAPARRARRDRPRARAGAAERDLSPSRAPARRDAQSRSTGPSSYHSLNEPG